jgi:ribosomal protein S2
MRVTCFFFITLLFKSNGHLLVINTNPEYFVLNKNLSLLTLQTNPIFFNKSITIYKKYKTLRTSKISYCSFKWVGGTLTNWKQISKSVLTFAKFSERCEKFLLKNNIDFPRYKKIKTCFEGLIRKQHNKTLLAFYEKPDIIFLVNPNENKNIISEANKLHIPVIAFAGSNTDIKGITYPIPLNTYSMSFVYYCLKKIIKISIS